MPKVKENDDDDEIDEVEVQRAARPLEEEDLDYYVAENEEANRSLVSNPMELRRSLRNKSN